MPLSDPAERNLLHLRDIQLRGYQRKDGLFDIEAHLVDTKSYGFNNEGRGWIEPGEALHGMWIRMTITEDFEVLSCEASSDFTPYDVCPANERVGGIHGCTHLREVIGQMGTVAFQTLYPVRRQRELEQAAARRASGEVVDEKKVRPALIGTCIAYAPDSPVVKQRWPWYEPEKAE
jgi:hypothetical protein